VGGLTNDEIARLYETHGRELLLFVTRRTCDAQVALDLLSETFAQAVLSRAKFRGDGDVSARAWLYAIARHQLAQYYRRGRVERSALKRLGLEPIAAPDDELRRVEELAGVPELREPLAAALAAVSDEQRVALRLRVVEGQSYAEIATRLGVSEQTVRARVSRGLCALRDLLGRQHLTEVTSVD
jgi:RNA polymerase sigma-70 factor (ECF subfamily)